MRFSGRSLFAGTLVATESGQKPIEQVTAGERVWSCDLVSGDWKLCKVAETYVFDHVGERIEVFVAGQKIESTYHHPYWVIEGEYLDERPKPDHVVEAAVPGATVPGRWVDAGDLHVGDKLLLMDGRHATIEEILVRHVEEPVYNFAVDRLHNYAVGPDCVLVHNSCGDNVGRAADLIPNKALRAGVELSFSEAVEHVRFGGDVLANSRSIARRIAEAVSVDLPICHRALDNRPEMGASKPAREVLSYHR